MRVVTAFLVLLVACPLAAEVAVANPSVTPAMLEGTQLRDVLLGRTRVWPGGMPVVLVLSKESGDEASMSKICGRRLNHLLRGWKRLAFSGGGVMPTVVEDRGAALRRIAEIRGAVAVLDLPADADVPEGLQRLSLTH